MSMQISTKTKYMSVAIYHSAHVAICYTHLCIVAKLLIIIITTSKLTVFAVCSYLCCVLVIIATILNYCA